MAAFQQAGIPVQKGAEFEALKAGIERAFSTAGAEQFLKKLESKGIRVRQFEKALDKKAFEAAGVKDARKLYDALSVGDQGQIRELYLRKLEQIDDAMRVKFHKIYVMY